MPGPVELSDEEAAIAVRLFKLLLKGYERFRPVPQVARLDGIADLLAGFREVAAAASATALSPREVDALFAGHRATIERDRVFQESAADDFNLLDVLQSTYKETRHSMVLAWLLDSDLRRH